MLNKLRNMLPSAPDKSDSAFIVGSWSLCHGASLIYPPAGWIVFGSIMIVLSVVLTRAGK